MTYELFYSRPNIHKYNLILDVFSNNKLNSIKTSTVPHVQYWKNTEKSILFIEKNLNISFTKPKLYFEYSTPSYKSNKSSMTDLMIRDSNYKIAIEVKYTEYAKSTYELIPDWFIKGNKENREKVLNHWYENIKDFIACDKIDSSSTIPYQFLHRTASACFDNKKQAIVIYQLFYDEETKLKLDNFISLITKSVQFLKPKEKLSFYIWNIETELQNTEVSKDNVFQEMKRSDIYKFGNQHCNHILNDI